MAEPRQWRWPKSARPIRTVVAPSSIATSKSSLMPIDSSRRTLFDWSGPTRCHVAPSTSPIFASASWTRFSPKVISPAATAARSVAAGTVFETATRATDAGSRPTRAHAFAIRSSTCPRASASGATPGRSGVSAASGFGGITTEWSFAAEEARDFEVVGVVGRRALDRDRLADRPLHARAAGHRRRGVIVAIAIRGPVARLEALALQLLEEVALAGCAQRGRRLAR